MHLGTIAIPSAVEGLDQAIERARAFAAAGADLTFVEAPVSLPELERIAKDVGVPQVANIVFGGKTPDPGRKHLGFAIVLYANAILQAALKASHEVLTGTTWSAAMRRKTSRPADRQDQDSRSRVDPFDRAIATRRSPADVQACG